MPNKGTAKTALARNPYILPSFIVVVILFLFAVIFMWLQVTLKSSERSVVVGKQVFLVEVADTVAEREKGLSERDSLPENRGMLFDFKEDGEWSMWMIRMRFPLDIAWLDQNGKIIYLRENISADTFPNVFQPEQPARYVLELNAGTFEKLGVKTGDTVRLE